jgi:DNA-binding SARP family transcriptional activator
VHIGVLGAFELWRGAGEVADHRPDDANCAQGLAPKERLLLARLVSDVGRPVGVDALASALWDGRPPPTAAKALQVHVMRVRSFLEPGRPASTSRFLMRQGPGYSLLLRSLVRSTVGAQRSS